MLNKSMKPKNATEAFALVFAMFDIIADPEEAKKALIEILEATEVHDAKMAESKALRIEADKSKQDLDEARSVASATAETSRNLLNEIEEKQENLNECNEDLRSRESALSERSKKEEVALAEAYEAIGAREREVKTRMSNAVTTMQTANDLTEKYANKIAALEAVMDNGE